MSEREEVVPRYKSTLPFILKGQDNEQFEQKAQNFEPLIHYVVEQEAATQGIKISRGVKPVLVNKQKIQFTKSRTISSRRCSYGYKSEVQ